MKKAAPKVNLWRVSKGSVFECVAIMDLIEALKINEWDFEGDRNRLSEIRRMLSGLIRWILQNPKGVNIKPKFKLNIK